MSALKSWEHRFWEKVCTPAHPDGCMEWAAKTANGGYGSFWLGRQLTAHRVSYELAYGAIPHGLVIDHLCRNRRCVRPDHLEAVTQAENIRRGDTGKHQRDKTHCKRGHLFSPQNTIITSSGHRRCRECKNQSRRA